MSVIWPACSLCRFPLIASLRTTFVIIDTLVFKSPTTETTSVI